MRSENYEAFLKMYNENNLRTSDWFGGVYFDDNGELCMRIVEGEQSRADDLIGETDNVHIRFENGRYSYRQLSEMCAEILNSRDNTGIIGAGVDVKNNRITLAVTEDFDGNRTSLGDEFFIERFDRLGTDISFQSADTLTDGKCFFAAGYPVKSDKNVRGIVTAGHISDIKKEMPVFLGKDEIGSVHDYEFSSVMDAAFVELNGSSCSNIISSAPNTQIDGLAPELICGAAVEICSGNSVRTGRIAYPRFDFMAFKNITVFTYSAAAGDSGAPILVPFTSGKFGLVGIHLGTLSMNGKVYSYGRSAEDINKRFSLGLDIK